jgi:hypothetical protein
MDSSFAAMLFQLIVIRRKLGVYDESLELYCAEHVLEAPVTYRDFWTMYGPAQFYVLAAFFKLLGVGRFCDALVRADLASICLLLRTGWPTGLLGACLRDCPGLDQLHLRSR